VQDVLSDQGCLDVGLDITYPLDANGSIVTHTRCQPIGQHAWDDELDGVACRSAALLTPEGEELAWFDRPRKRLSASGPPSDTNVAPFRLPQGEIRLGWF